jgi:hypothetical protein
VIRPGQAVRGGLDMIDDSDFLGLTFKEVKKMGSTYTGLCLEAFQIKMSSVRITAEGRNSYSNRFIPKNKVAPKKGVDGSVVPKILAAAFKDVEGSPAPKPKSSEVSGTGIKLERPLGFVYAEARKKIRLAREKADRLTDVDNSLSGSSRPPGLWTYSVKKECDVRSSSSPQVSPDPPGYDEPTAYSPEDLARTACSGVALGGR